MADNTLLLQTWYLLIKQQYHTPSSIHLDLTTLRIFWCHSWKLSWPAGRLWASLGQWSKKFTLHIYFIYTVALGWGLILARGIFFLLHSILAGFVAHPAPYPKGNGSPIPESSG
jgi:hypothetical protein